MANNKNMETGMTVWEVREQFVEDRGDPGPDIRRHLRRVFGPDIASVLQIRREGVERTVKMLRARPKTTDASKTKEMWEMVAKFCGKVGEQ